MKECPFCRHCFPDQFNNCPSDGGVLAYSIPGDTVLDSRYQLERRLGQGGMGIVFKARHIFLKTSYAIKVILPDLVGNDPMLATRFRQEAMVAARIDHRNIVSVTDFGVVEGKMPYLVMDFIKGRSLHDLLGVEGRLAPGPSLEIMTALCAGVGAAHRQGIVHRDLKPLNVMLQENMPISEAVKVLDFGLAKIKSGELLGSFVAAQTTGLMGSPYYMAPEQWSDEEPDSRADIYSLGVMLFQMLAGDVPFKGPTLPSIMNKHINELPPSLITLGINVPQNLEAVIRRAMAKKRNDRMSSVEEFISEFRAALDSYDSAFAHTKTEMTLDSQLMTMPFPKTADHGSVTNESLDQAPWVAKSDSQQRIEDEADRLKREFEEAQRRADEARARAEDAARKRAEEDAARRKAEEEAARKLAEEEEARQRAEEEARKREEEAAARHREEQEAARKLAEEEARQRAEAEEARKRAAEEATRLAREVLEAQQRAEEARLRAEDEARKRTEEQVARKRAEEEAHRLLGEVSEAQRRAEEARMRAEEEARIRAAEEQERKRVEEQLERKRVEESLRIHAEGELARKQAVEDADRLAREVADAQRKADEARSRAEEEARRRAEAENALHRAEEEARKLAQQVSEAQRRAEESRRRSEEEAARRAEIEEQERREQLAQQQLAATSLDAATPFPGLSNAATSQSAFDQNAASHSQSAGEHTILHQGQPFNQSEGSWPSVAPVSGFGKSAEPAKTSYAVPISIAVVVVVLLGIVGGAGALYSTKWFGAKTTTTQPETPPPPKQSNPETNPPTPAAPEMVKIEGGSFQMGLQEVPTKSSYDLAQYPARTVNVKTFWMDKTEVTNAAYLDFVADAKYAAPSYWRNGKPPAGQEQWPVTNVSVADANAFAQWRSKRDGTKCHLPTEEQWEYAARNGAEATLYPWGNEWQDDHANVDANSLKPVGSFPKGASKSGVLDLIGNVWEWTSSKAAAYPGNTVVVMPSGQVIIRGGAYVETSRGDQAVSSTRRSAVAPSDKQAAIGFRLVHE